MKMKKNIYAFILGLMVASCNYTDLTPMDSFTDKSYWNTTNDMKLYANGLYGLLSSPSPTLDNESDNFVTSNYSALLYNEQTIPSEGGGWSWGDIRNCNYFMARYQKVQGNEKEINKYVGEVRFFRALLYFDKIKQFGDVPYYDTDLQTTDKDQLYKARDSRNTVLTKIIEDLEFAIANLPEKSESEVGRLNKDAARVQLARVCLYYGTYMKYHGESANTSLSTELLNKAVTITDDIINSGKYEIVKGSDAGCDQLAKPGYPLYYSDQFTQGDLTSNKECILARHYEEGILAHYLGRSVEESGLGLTKDFAESFLMKDGTPIYNDNSKYKGDDDLETEMTDRDPRIYQIIDNANKPYYVRNGERVANVLAIRVMTSKAVTGYYCVKYHHANTSQQEAQHSTFDWFVYRYAEVLLINAEANAELGKCTQSVLDRTINKLRDRVEMAHLTTNPVADAKPINYGYQISNLLYEIRRERRIELIAEGFRLDDIKRWNATQLLANPKTVLGIIITPTVISEYPANTFGGENGRPTIEYAGKTYLYQYKSSKQLDDKARVWNTNDKRWLSPIPTQELTLNHNLTQNPGW